MCILCIHPIFNALSRYVKFILLRVQYMSLHNFHATTIFHVSLFLMKVQAKVTISFACVVYGTIPSLFFYLNLCHLGLNSYIPHTYMYIMIWGNGTRLDTFIKWISVGGQQKKSLQQHECLYLADLSQSFVVWCEVQTWQWHWKIYNLSPTSMNEESKSLKTDKRISTSEQREW